mmetsp:Transcript_27074/g.105367  ORF Transcript_27074/g.105367 Transcript_27074/m.105367 type:complete len:84 (+) Transcript_27074:335-586(+)
MLEKEYQEKLAKFKASEGDVSKMVKEREEKEIEAVKEAASKEKDAVRGNFTLSRLTPSKCLILVYYHRQMCRYLPSLWSGCAR